MKRVLVDTWQLFWFARVIGHVLLNQSGKFESMWSNRFGTGMNIKGGGREWNLHCTYHSGWHFWLQFSTSPSAAPISRQNVHRHGSEFFRTGEHIPQVCLYRTQPLDRKWCYASFRPPFLRTPMVINEAPGVLESLFFKLNNFLCSLTVRIAFALICKGRPTCLLQPLHEVCISAVSWHGCASCVLYWS